MIQQILVILIFALALAYLVGKFIWKPAFLKQGSKDDDSGCGSGSCGCHWAGCPNLVSINWFWEFNFKDQFSLFWKSMKIVLISFIILTAILWCWAVFDLVKSRFKNPIHKALGLLMILFFPVLGSILYFQLKEGFVQKKRREFNPDFTYLRKN